jgi:hypothetical protein
MKDVLIGHSSLADIHRRGLIAEIAVIIELLSVESVKGTAIDEGISTLLAKCH